MARYLARACPKCGGYLGAVIPEHKRSVPVRAINGRCAKCGYRLDWIMFLGKIFKRRLSDSKRPTQEQCE